MGKTCAACGQEPAPSADECRRALQKLADETSRTLERIQDALNALVPADPGLTPEQMQAVVAEHMEAQRVILGVKEPVARPLTRAEWFRADLLSDYTDGWLTLPKLTSSAEREPFEFALGPALIVPELEPSPADLEAAYARVAEAWERIPQADRELWRRVVLGEEEPATVETVASEQSPPRDTTQADSGSAVAGIPLEVVR